MSELPEEIRQAIEEVRAGRSTSLDLGDTSLTEIPDEIFALSALERLSLSGSGIRVVPDRIKTLPNLKILHLDYTPVERVPDVPGLGMEWETFLRCKETLSPSNIRHLLVDMGGGQDSTQPVLQSDRLRVTLSELPDWISELRDLESLHQGLNDLNTLPASIGSLSRLRSLDIGSNDLPELPEVVFHLRPLESLFLYGYLSAPHAGRIKLIPASILELPNLKHLDVEDQPIETPPPEVVEEGVEAIKNYWRQQQEAGTDYLCEAKLLIVGEAGAGKTSLARKIQDPGYRLRPREPSTEGIEVLSWRFPTALRVKRDGEEKLLEREYRVNVWDFGGQEIYHATHQFFLTRRSLYVLVADDRKEDTDFNWWLQVVELLSDGSPLLIVQNEKQDRQRDINFSSLRARFPNLKSALRTNLANNRGLDDLMSAIRQELERIPHIGTPLPATWRRVRQALEGDERNYMGLDDFLGLCEKEGFQRREDKMQLGGYLHDLGICLHFQDDPMLKNWVILKPKWGTDAAYRVLDDREVTNNRGRFDTGDLQRIWAEDEYAPLRDELLRLMKRFQLCYELPEGNAFIAPHLLPSDQPEYEIQDQDSLILRYGYEFMPKGMITRFIVALHHLIADQRLVWKTGVVLEREDSQAEVIEDYPHRKILVRVAGSDTRGLLAIVDDQLERIHRSFSRLKYEKFLPCHCPRCAGQSEPYLFSLNELRDFARTGDGIQCRISRRLVDAAALIRDVMPSALRQDDRLVTPSGVPEPPESVTPESEPAKEVFVSYAWGSEESVAIVDQLEAAFRDRDIRLLRDKNELTYKDPIRNFMERLGRGKCIVVVLSKAYLESKSCMFELTQIAEHGDVYDRVFPIVLKNAGIYEAITRLRSVKHWETKKTELDAAIKDVGSENLEGIREEIDLYAKIRTTAARIMDILADMNALTPERHRGSRFEDLFRLVEERISK